MHVWEYATHRYNAKHNSIGTHHSPYALHIHFPISYFRSPWYRCVWGVDLSKKMQTRTLSSTLYPRNVFKYKAHINQFVLVELLYIYPQTTLTISYLFHTSLPFAQPIPSSCIVVLITVIYVYIIIWTQCRISAAHLQTAAPIITHPEQSLS